MLRFSDVKSYVSDALVALGTYGDTSDTQFPVIDPGPPTDQLMKLSPNRLIFLTIGAGAGFTTEQLYDRPFISARVLGLTRNYQDADNLALDLDKILTDVVKNTVIGTAKVLYITRTGGRPTLYSYDASERYNFTCSYITEAKTE